MAFGDEEEVTTLVVGDGEPEFACAGESAASKHAAFAINEIKQFACRRFPLAGAANCKFPPIGRCKEQH